MRSEHVLCASCLNNLPSHTLKKIEQNSIARKLHNYGLARILAGTMDQAVHSRNEEKRCDRRKSQSADNGASERRILLAAFTEAERQRHHANNHGHGRHDHWAKTS